MFPFFKQPHGLNYVIMKKLLCFLAFWAFSLTGLQAQQSENIYLKQVSPSNSYAPQNISGEGFFSSFSQLPFLSDFQQAAMDANQVANINVDGSDNVTKLIQSGTANIGLINVLGDENSTSLNQAGTGLLSIMNIRGSSNTMNMDQVGNNLQNYVQLTGSAIDIDLVQNKSGIQLTQTGGNAIPLQIKRNGQSVPIIINNN